MKSVAVLGSTGSIGVNTLEVIAEHPDRLRAVALAAHSSLDVLLAQAEATGARHLCLTDPEAATRLRERVAGRGVTVHDTLEDLVALDGIDVVVGAVVGAAGMQANLAAVRRGLDLALANKETLVMAGDLVMAAARESGAHVLPVDSEHSAIWQCLWGAREDGRDVEELILTASGGPFFGRTRGDLAGVTREAALDHPTWKMGPKITIDSATLMNKGLEVIEARHLFGIPAERIRVRVHRQSIVHSLVTFVDGSQLAQLGWPDMKLPIQVALSWPERWPNDFRRLDLAEAGTLTFDVPDTEAFPALALAFEAAGRGGTAECVLNAANEAAVGLFLDDRIPFLEIAERIASALRGHAWQAAPDLDALIAADAWAREHVENA